MTHLLIGWGPVIGYLVVALAAIRFCYIKIVDERIGYRREAQLSALICGLLWPLTLIVVVLWYLGQRVLFRETPGERKVRKLNEKHGRGTW